MKDDTQINTTKRTRAPKQSTGTMLWIPATCLTEVKAIVDRDAAMRKAQATEKLRQRVQRDTERLKALAADATENQQLNSIGVNPVIDSTQNVPVQVHETLPEMAYTSEPEYLTDTPETPVTGYKQAGWCDPVLKRGLEQNQRHAAYDGTTSLLDALSDLFNKPVPTNADARAKWTLPARTSLGIEKAGANEQKVAIYQWFVDNPGQWPKV